MSEFMDIINISVVIATMNRVKTLEETIEHLAKSSVYPAEIIVVDQSTTDDVVEEIKKLINTFDMNIKYVHNTPSLTKARNLGLKLAENDVVVFMDDDVNVLEDTFKKIYGIMQDNTISMIAGLDKNARPNASKMGYIFAKKSYKKRNVGHVAGGMYGRLPYGVTSRITTEWAMGFFFVIRKSLVEKWGLEWEEKFESYGYPEDLDFSYRYYFKSRENNLQCIIDPDVAVYHMVSQEWRETPRKVTYMQIVNREYITYKMNLGFKSRLLTRWSNFGLFIQRLLSRDNCFDVLKAQFYCDLYRKDIKQGNLHTEMYNK